MQWGTLRFLAAPLPATVLEAGTCGERRHQQQQNEDSSNNKLMRSRHSMPLTSSSSSLLAGRPHSSLAAHSVVAALPLPPPRPAQGTSERR